MAADRDRRQAGIAARAAGEDVAEAIDLDRAACLLRPVDEPVAHLLFLADKASRRKPTSQKQPISAERSSVSHKRLGLISRTLGAGIWLAPLVLIDDGLQCG